MAWAVRVEKAENGFIVTPLDDEEDNMTHLSIEQTDPEMVDCPDGKELKDYELTPEQKAKLDEQCGMVDMLWFLREYFGCHNDKYGATRLEIRIKLVEVNVKGDNNGA